MGGGVGCFAGLLYMQAAGDSGARLGVGFEVPHKENMTDGGAKVEIQSYYLCGKSQFTKIERYYLNSRCSWL